MKYDLGIIGLGASGLFAAYLFERLGKGTCLAFDKNKKPGKKLLLTERHRFNISNTAKLPDFVNAFFDNGSFVLPALNAFSSGDLIDLLNGCGIETVVRDYNRVSPRSGKVSDIIETFSRVIARSERITTRFNTPVTDVTFDAPSKNFMIYCGKDRSICRNLLLCCGGITYPETGSTGDGYDIARKFGHTIIPPRGIMAPMIIQDQWVRKLAQTSIPNVTVRFVDRGKQIYNRGNLEFLSTGLGGSAILNTSWYMVKSGKRFPLKLTINFTQVDTADMFFKSFKQELSVFSRKTVYTVLKKHFPTEFLDGINDNFSLDLHRKSSDFSSFHRKVLLNILTKLEVTVTGPDEARAMLTSGGVDIRGINKKTMMSRHQKGLFFAGEIVDLDAQCGGYNLQTCFSTAFLAIKNLNLQEIKAPPHKSITGK